MHARFFSRIPKKSEGETGKNSICGRQILYPRLKKKRKKVKFESGAIVILIGNQFLLLLGFLV
jgi:hypothetical protein